MWHLHCMRYYNQSRADLKYMGGCTSVICKYYAILYKGLEHPWILVSMGSWNQSPQAQWLKVTSCPAHALTGQCTHRPHGPVVQARGWEAGAVSVCQGSGKPRLIQGHTFLQQHFCISSLQTSSMWYSRKNSIWESHWLLVEQCISSFWKSGY